MFCPNFTWEQFRDAIAISVILKILHKAFTVSASNVKTIVFIVPTLLGFSQIMSIGMEKGPFTTHSKTMRMAIVSYLMSIYLAYGMKLDRLKNNPTYPFHCMVFLGNMAIAALVSTFFPDFIGPVLYLLCVLISVGELLFGYFNTTWRCPLRFLLGDILPK